MARVDPKYDRFNGIQALRFLAALLVVVTHATFYTHERLNDSLPIWSFGAIGVDIFFVVSGFVMMVTAGSFSDTEGWKRFAARRILRIVPLYWIATTIKLITLLMLPAVVLHAELNPVNVIFSYFFIPSTNVDGRFEPLLGVGWTLIFEMFFYAIFTLALALRVRILPFVGVLLVVCCFISIYRTPEWPAGTIYFNPIILFFFVGMVFAVLSSRCKGLNLIIFAMIGFLACIAWSIFLDAEIVAKAKSFPGFVFACSVVLFFIGLEPVIGRKIPSWLLLMGEASYALYLFHPLIAPAVPHLFMKLGINLPYVSVMISIVISIIAAYFVHKVIEKPVTRILKPYIPYAGSLKKS